VQVDKNHSHIIKNEWWHDLSGATTFKRQARLNMRS